MGKQPWTPNLIMPGVAKCGTTTLHDLLAAHPQVQSGIEKEVRFLMDENETQPRETDIHKHGTEGWQTRYPSEARQGTKIWIDATPQYQYQKTAYQVVSDLAEKPYILIIVRRPSDRLFSMYQYAKYHQKTTPFISDFPAFIKAIRGRPDDRLRDQTMLYNAWPDTDYATLCDNWSAMVGKEKFMCVSLEDLIADQNAVLSKIASFLAIDLAAYPETAQSQANPTVVTKSRAFRIVGSRVARHLPNTGIFRKLKDFGKQMNSGLIDRSEKAGNESLLAEIDTSFADSCNQARAKWGIENL
ncbi:sulfotransferase domain-containing protein [Sphingorhabdus sp. Alg239-R122]|uniref:sulfotransferase family protein n=1 Tax=Sphingorhabdus sp. Alg239-R122 TaxID=2305989 RepID=UPI0013DB88BF|nr:sulfotransferase domain-containing protein [Sphingorhabdus sp. Alg239-R122]